MPFFSSGAFSAFGESSLMFSNNQLCYLFHWFFPIVSVFHFIAFCFHLYNFLPSVGFSFSFSKSLRWQLRLLIWDFSSFSMYAFSVINFLSSSLAMSHKLCYLVFLFPFSSLYFFTSLEMSSLTHGLLRNVSFCFQVFSFLFSIVDF